MILKHRYLKITHHIILYQVQKYTLHSSCPHYQSSALLSFIRNKEMNERNEMSHLVETSLKKFYPEKSLKRAQRSKFVGIKTK